MKHIKIYINEKLHITTNSFYTCQPKTKKELKEIIIQRIKDDGPECNLNDIDVSKITDMSNLFDGYNNTIFYKFNGDISQWNVSNVKDMYCMFFGCEKFNGDLSKWDVSNVKNMSQIFYKCPTFNCDLSQWDVSKVEDMKWAFYKCPTKPKWYDEDEWDCKV